MWPANDAWEGLVNVLVQTWGRGRGVKGMGVTRRRVGGGVASESW